MAEKLTRKRAIVAAALSLALVLPAGAEAVWALDRFVIQHVEITDVAAYEAENSTVATVDAATIAATEVATATLAAPVGLPTERIVLDLALLARSWVRVVADNRVALEAVLEPGELRSFEATESIVLRTGNGAGVQATLNGQTLPPLGGSGEVVEVQWRIVDGQIVQSTPTPLPPAAPATEPDPGAEPAPEDTPTPEDTPAP